MEILSLLSTCLPNFENERRKKATHTHTYWKQQHQMQNLSDNIFIKLCLWQCPLFFVISLWLLWLFFSFSLSRSFPFLFRISVLIEMFACSIELNNSQFDPQACTKPGNGNWKMKKANKRSHHHWIPIFIGCELRGEIVFSFYISSFILRAKQRKSQCWKWLIFENRYVIVTSQCRSIALQYL